MLKMSMTLNDENDFSSFCTDKTDKIILNRIISVVWLTSFLSEIRNLTNPRWCVEQQFLSVKRSLCPHRIQVHWWSLIFLIRKVEGLVAVWVVLPRIVRFSYQIQKNQKYLLKTRELLAVDILEPGHRMSGGLPLDANWNWKRASDDASPDPPGCPSPLSPLTPSVA